MYPLRTNDTSQRPFCLRRCGHFGIPTRRQVVKRISFARHSCTSCIRRIQASLHGPWIVDFSTHFLVSHFRPILVPAPYIRLHRTTGSSPVNKDHVLHLSTFQPFFSPSDIKSFSRVEFHHRFVRRWVRGAHRRNATRHGCIGGCQNGYQRGWVRG